MTNGYVQVNLKNINGMNYSNYEINELEISTSNPTNYVGLDALPGQKSHRLYQQFGKMVFGVMVYQHLPKMPFLEHLIHMIWLQKHSHLRLM